jgi:hypothetical protein
MSAYPGQSHDKAESRVTEFLTVQIVMTVVALVVVSIRVWVRLKLVPPVGIDDGFIVASMVGTPPPPVSMNCMVADCL